MKTNNRHRPLRRGQNGKRPFQGKAPQREGPQRIVGILSKATNGWRLQSTNRRERGEFILHAKTNFDLKQGELAVAEILPSHNRYGPKEAKLIEILGSPDHPKAVSLIAIAQHEIPTQFDEAALEEAAQAKPVCLEASSSSGTGGSPPPLGGGLGGGSTSSDDPPSAKSKGLPRQAQDFAFSPQGEKSPFIREDLRSIPLVTIDGPDARDFDDAVFAEPHNNGWHLIVAIADVSHYVKPGSALDRAAYERGNSVYFPDHVVPMLPEALSNELCSLKPNVERACMAAHLWIDGKGELTRWQFVRGVMRSHARFTYEQVQQAMDGAPDSTTEPLLDKVIRPLYAAYKCLMQARLHRGTLELNLPERKVEIDKHGKVRAIKIRDRLDSHKLIEEFMITANVAAAAQLQGKGGVCLYRVHDRPTEMKLEALRDFLNSLKISLVPGKQLHSRFLTKILEDHAGGPHAEVLNEVMLRSQAQAVYSPANIGHFGLALAKYAHFTSPIRRYADLIVHRALIRGGKLGSDGLTDGEIQRLEKIAEYISTTERRASTAERDATDRFTTLYMADKVGGIFPARISGVARFGLFARLDETGADGIIPLQSLPNDYYIYDEKKQAYIGRRSKRVYRLAQRVTVKLEQADKLTGSMSFTIVEENSAGENITNRTSTSLRPRDEKKRGGRRRSRGRHG